MSFSVIALALFAVACSAQKDWRVVKSNIATIDIGVSFLNPLVGYTAGTLNGQSIVVSAEAGELYSADGGKSFHQSIGGGMSQSVRHIGPNGDGGHKYGVTGNYGARHKDGVAISVNSGRTFTAYDANLFTEARYGAFPGAAQWYVAAGEWPQSPQPTSDDDGPVRGRRFRGKTQLFGRDGRLLSREARLSVPVSDDNGTYAAQISKTTDGGITWTTLFAENNTFYFNGIDCNPSDVNHCCAAGEGFSQPPVPSLEPGARIHCTHDGGKSWNRTFWKPEDPNQAYSIMEMRFASATEVFAVGGILGSIPTPWFLHSKDGGATWTTDAPAHMRGAMATSVSMVTPVLGFAVLENTITQAADIAKYGGL